MAAEDFWDGTAVIAASASADEVQVKEAEISIERGRAITCRDGLPPTGACRDTTYRKVEVKVEVQGRSGRDKESER